MSKSTESYICTTCSRSYKRREHLQRHALTHLARRPHRCNICTATFSRTDILRRHIQTCSAKPDETHVSRRRRACDKCARQKKACSLGQPCHNCQLKAIPCQYSYAVEHTIDDEPVPSSEMSAGSWNPLDPSGLSAYGATRGATTMNYVGGDIDLIPDLDMVFQGALPDFRTMEAENNTLNWLNFPGGPENISLSEIYDLNTADSGRKFQFLYNFTSRTGLSSTFDCGSLAQRQQVLAFWSEEQANHITQATGEDPTRVSSNETGFKLPQPCDPLLVAKSHDIVSRLKEIVTSKPRNSVVSLSWTATYEQQCLQFFSPSNIRCFLALYWAIWHPNVNFVHMPTFDPAQCKSSLLAAMVVIGACVSPLSAHTEQAKTWFECVEEMVFGDEDFAYDLPTSERNGPNIQSQKSRIQALQAAYMVCLYQNWEGSDVSRRRIRRYRFSTLVSMVRDTNVETARDVTGTIVPGDSFNWNEFVAREELIRTFLWIFLLDTCFVIFNNLPPRMVIGELQMRMACPESCFQASTAKECTAAIHDWMSQSSSTSKISLRKAIQIFCSDDLPPYLRCGLANLGPLNLFVIISAFHILIFQRMNSFSDGGHIGAIQNAMHNWQDIWELYILDFSTGTPHAMVESESLVLAPQDMWKRIGFARHAHEFWLLASIIIDRMILKSVPEQSLDSDKNELGTIIDPVLPEYDQNNMRQVNELIASFENARII